MNLRAVLLTTTILAAACGDSSVAPTATRPTVDSTGTWPEGSPGDHGFDADRLNAAADALAAPRSKSLLVVHDGEIILERYWEGHGPDLPLPVFSVTKSFASTLVGVAEQQRLLDREDRASDFIPQWIGGESEALTIRHLMTGDSGRTWDFAGDYPGSLGGGETPPDLTEYALNRGQQFEAETTWQYNQMAIQCLDRVLSTAAGQRTVDFARESLFDRLGMNGTQAAVDDAGQMTLAYGIESTARDMARLGYLYLHEGRWNGESVLSPDFVRAATHTANPISSNYGYLFWLNADREWFEPVTLAYHETAKVYPSAPPDVFVASGFLGQLILVSPSEDLIIVRQGAGTTPGFADHYDEIYRRIAEARISP